MSTTLIVFLILVLKVLYFRISIFSFVVRHHGPSQGGPNPIISKMDLVKLSHNLRSQPGDVRVTPWMSLF
jgi:hypothetical protein